MKKLVLFLVLMPVGLAVYAQDENAPDPGQVQEQQLENLAEQLESETEDDSFLQSLLQFKKNKINLNTAEAGELRELKLLSDLQIDNLLRYRRLLGNFISIYELQAVPTIDVETLRKILPYVRVGNVVPLSNDIGKRFTQGSHTLLMRAQQVLETSEGFLRPDTISNRYLGSRQRLFFRYKYTYRNLLQFGLVGDKDAGEQFFKGRQKSGFDFYSFHLFARKLGIVKLLALGDFTVNMGQGLIQWQSLAFKKSADITNIKRQADILRPYNSATEYNFQRGAGITLQKNHLEFTAFASIRNVDANLQADTVDNANDFVSSILASGYHRTPNELAKKNTIQQTGVGANVSYNRTGFHVGVNGVSFSYSTPLLRDVQPYNQFAIQGSNWSNGSVDYSYTYRNMHFFGEAAIDKNRSTAFLNGVMVSLDAKGGWLAGVQKY